MASGAPSGVKRPPMTKAVTIDVPPLVRQQASINLNELKMGCSKRHRSIGADMLKESPHLLASQGNLSELVKVVDKLKTVLHLREHNGETLLHAATKTNQIPVMQYLIDSGINLNAVDNDGNTALHVAVINGHIDAAHLLLTSGASDTILNKKMDAPLHIVARNNDTNMMGAFLEHQVKLGIRGYRNRSPLHIIAEFDNLEVCEVVHNSALCKSCEFRLCCKDEDNLTPIHLAARKGSHRVLNFMINAGKDCGYTTEIIMSFIDEENSTPLHTAIAGGNLEVVKVLLNHGASPTTTREDQPPPVHLACSQGELEMVKAMVQQCGKEILLHTDLRGLSVLHYCWTASNSAQLVSYLVEHGADVTIKDSHGRTALHTAILAGSLTTVKELLSSGANPLEKDDLGCNSLHYAVQHKRTAITNTLLELSSASQLVSELNDDGRSPIHCAIMQKAGDLALSMLSIGGRQALRLRDQQGNTCLILAAISGDSEALSALLSCPASQKLINEANDKGVTALHYAAIHGHARCVEILLSKGAMSHKCYHGATPFTAACYMGHADCAKLLHSAHPYQRDWTSNEGNTALHFAAISRNPAVVTLALEIGVQITLNAEQNSFFDLIIENGDTRSALAVVSHDRWQECLDCFSPLRPHPMLRLILQMPEVARAVLDRCLTKASVNSKHPDYWEEFDFKYLYLMPGSHQRNEEDGNLQLSVNNPLFLDHLAVKASGPHDSPVPAPSKTKCCLRLDAVKRMVRYHHCDLLVHPVVKAYLKLKWRSYARWIVLLQSAVHLFQVVLLTVFIAIAPIDSSDPSTSVRPPNSSNYSESQGFEYKIDTNAVRIATIAMCFINTLFFIWAVLSMRLKVLNFIDSPGMWVQAAEIICVFLFLIPAHPNWEAGALAIFFGWMKITLHLQLYDLFGIYVIMLISITRTVLKVLVIAVLLITAFALSLYVLAGTVMEFSTIGFSLFNTFGYMLGEIQYDRFVSEHQNNNLPYSSVTFLLVLVLAVLLSIVMANLLIGLAVGDIEKIKMNAITEKVGIEIKMFLALDQSLPEIFLRRFDKRIHRRHPNRTASYVTMAIRRILQVNDVEDEDIQAHLTQQETNQELATIKEQLKEMMEVMKRLEGGQTHTKQSGFPSANGMGPCRQKKD